MATRRVLRTRPSRGVNRAERPDGRRSWTTGPPGTRYLRPRGSPLPASGRLSSGLLEDLTRRPKSRGQLRRSRERSQRAADRLRHGHPSTRRVDSVQVPHRLEPPPLTNLVDWAALAAERRRLASYAVSSTSNDARTLGWSSDRQEGGYPRERGAARGANWSPTTQTEHSQSSLGEPKSLVAAPVHVESYPPEAVAQVRILSGAPRLTCSYYRAQPGKLSAVAASCNRSCYELIPRTAPRRSCTWYRSRQPSHPRRQFRSSRLLSGWRASPRARSSRPGCPVRRGGAPRGLQRITIPDAA